MNFFRGLLSIALIYTIAWGIFQFGYSHGSDAEKCKERSGYQFNNVKWFAWARK